MNSLLILLLTALVLLACGVGGARMGMGTAALGTAELTTSAGAAHPEEVLPPRVSSTGSAVVHDSLSGLTVAVVLAPLSADWASWAPHWWCTTILAASRPAAVVEPSCTVI